MAKGWYVIPSEGEPIECVGKGAYQKALKEGKELFVKGDAEVMLQHFDDDNDDGFFAECKCIFIKHIF